MLTARGRDFKTGRDVLDVLFPKVRAELLRILFDGARREHYVRELMQVSGLALRTVQDVRVSKSQNPAVIESQTRSSKKNDIRTLVFRRV